MTTLAHNKSRAYEAGVSRNGFVLAASTRVYEGAAVGVTSAGGLARPLTSADRFVGFAEQQTDSRSVAVVNVISAGRVELPVTGVVVTSVGATVYATDDNAFTLTSAGAVAIGTVLRYVSDGVAMVSFDGSASASPGSGASAFVDLSDAPASITPNRVLIGNAAGDAVDFASMIEFDEDAAEIQISPPADDPTAGTSLVLFGQADGYGGADGGDPRANLYAGSSGAGAFLRFHWDKFIQIEADSDAAVISKSTGAYKLRLDNFDSVASDAAARLTVGGVEYSIAKVIDIKIGNDVFYVPLYGPV